MKKKLLLLCLLAATFFVKAQNVGIGTTAPLQKLHVVGSTFLNGNVGIGENTPAFPLSFGQAPGDKISLWSNSTNSYGFGIQSSLLQIYTDVSAADIAFGYGSSNSFTERLRIKNTGGYGMELNGRILLRNGTVPLDINYGPGIWLNKADNSGLLGFMGTQNNQNIGFYGGTAGWGFTYDAVNSRVGIGTSAPAASLEVSGYTKLGSDAPIIKIKKLTGTTSATEGVGITIPHGLNHLKILSVSVIVQNAGGAWVGPNSGIASSIFHSDFNSFNIEVDNVFGASANILSKPIKVLIIYEE